MPRRRRSRIYWRNGRAWGDFRDVERQTTLGAYASEHLIAKAESGNIVRPWLVTVEKHLRVAVEYFGSGRELTAITPRDVQRFVVWLQRQPGRKGDRLAPGTVRQH